VSVTPITLDHLISEERSSIGLCRVYRDVCSCGWSGTWDPDLLFAGNEHARDVMAGWHEVLRHLLELAKPGARSTWVSTELHDAVRDLVREGDQE
jgi:hypothetical protein